MKTILFSLLSTLLIGFGFAASVQQQKTFVVNPDKEAYAILWEDVRKQEDLSLPESAQNKVDAIYEAALKEHNSPQLIKSLIYQLKYQVAKDKDVVSERIKEIETYTISATDVTEQSMLYGLLSQFYWKYYQSQQYTIDQRTAIAGDFVPEDIREWSGNLFIQRIADYVSLSVKNVDELQKTDILRYKDILNEGETSRKLSPTVYDFLVSEGINTLKNVSRKASTYFPQSPLTSNLYFSPLRTFVGLDIQGDTYDMNVQIIRLYQQILDFKRQNKDEEALLMVDLGRLEYVYNTATYELRGVDYMKALVDLEKQYAKNPVCVEVLYKQAMYYNNNNDIGIFPYRTSSGEIQQKFFEEEDRDWKINSETTYAICQKGIEQFPTYERIGLLENLQNALTQTAVSINFNKQVYPGKELELNVQYTNTQRLTVKVYRINEPATAYRDSWQKNGLYKKESSQSIGTYTYELKQSAPYLSQDTILKIPAPAKGLYELVAYANDKKDEQIVNESFNVSSLHVSVRRIQKGDVELLVTDYISGKPVDKFSAVFYKRDKGQYIEVRSSNDSKNGLMSVTNQENMAFYRVYTDSEKGTYLVSLPYYYSSSFNNTKEASNQVQLFTDRSIYRPGQTLYFKGIASSSDAKKQEVVKNQSFFVTLVNANGEEISKKQMRSNAFGSFAGEFALPTGGMNGNYSLQVKEYNAYHSFKVEEYKRPSFRIEFDTIRSTYGFGDVVKVGGKATTFSGISLQQTEVKYTVTRQPHWFWRSIRGNNQQISEGIVQTDSNGSFELSFTAEKSFSDSKNKEVYYNYLIETSITSASGETQTSETQIAIGSKSMVLSIEGNDLITKEHLSPLKISATNLNGRVIETSGTYELFRLIGDDTLATGGFAKKEYKTGELIRSGNFSTKDPLSSSFFDKQASGKYRIVLKANDDQKREVSTEKDFTLYSAKDKKPPYSTYIWLPDKNITFAQGETPAIYFGSSAKKVYVLQDLFVKGEKVESKRFQLNNSIEKILIPFKQEYAEGATVVFTFIKDKELFSERVTLSQQVEEKKLLLKTEVFRNKLLPGQQEEWKIAVKDEKQQAVDAEIMAAMYDASLDVLYPHAWFFSKPIYSTYQNIPSFESSRKYKYLNIQLPEEKVSVPGYSFDQFNWFGLNFYSGFMLRGMASGSIKSAAPKIMADGMVVEEAVISEALQGVVSDAQMDFNKEAPSSSEEVAAHPEVRKNLNETAFFYPQLKTNKDGETLISFTVPESNTTWKFMALAHTQDLTYGQLIKEAVSQKKLMVTPNMPRFMRQGDKTSISTLVSNLSDRQQKGEVAIFFFDPSNEAPLFIADKQTQYFDLNAGESTDFTWQFEVPAGLDLAGCKIIAQSEENFSDGEQHLLPVLTNKILVTESLPLALSDKGRKEFSFDKLLNKPSETAEDYRLTLEFSGNPAWYAVQALPAMSVPQNDNTVSWFAAYYANALASHIAQSPNVQRMIEIWKKQAGDKETLLSALEKNSELKAVLLEETPWVLEARSEAEQKQSLSLLLDANRNQQLIRTALGQLKKLQTDEGGWPWIEGMRGNTSITQWILYGLGSLEHLGAVSSDPSVAEMTEKALSFVDYQFQRNFENRKKAVKDIQKITTISSYETEYLYMRSFYTNSPITESKEAVDFYQNIIAKYWTKNTSLYQRSLMAVIQKRAGDEKTAQNILRSLREHATQHPEMGMYWANNTAYSFFFQSATGTHTFAMKAFEEVGSSREEINALKLWLLKQKQTQMWESTPATVNAVYALLNDQTGSNWLESKGEVKISLGKENIDLSQAEAGTGYVKKTYNGAEIKPELGKVAINKSDEGPAWGALYWQYFEESDKVDKAKTALRIEKKLFVEGTSSTGKVIREVNENTPVKVGDKVVVRLTIRTDRDMEFVSLKDLHGAGLEPVEQLSGMKWNNSLFYYQTSKDASTNFYFDSLPKGTYVLEYGLYAGREGNYSNGLATLQCMYAPEFISHSQGERIVINRP